MTVGTPLRNIRVAEDTWQDWRGQARARGVSVSELIREAVTVYLSGRPRPAPAVAVKPPKPQVTEPPPVRREAPRLVTVATPPPKARTSACRLCSACPDYTPNPRRMLHCQCGHGVGYHR